MSVSTDGASMKSFVERHDPVVRWDDDLQEELKECFIQCLNKKDWRGLEAAVVASRQGKS